MLWTNWTEQTSTEGVSKWLRTRHAAEAGRGPDRVPALVGAQSLAAEANRDRVPVPEVRALSLARDLSPGRSLRSATTKITANRGPEVGVSHRTVGGLAVVL